MSLPEPTLKKYKYQIKIKLLNGRIRYVHSNDSIVVEAYVKTTKGKIIWVKEI